MIQENFETAPGDTNFKEPLAKYDFRDAQNRRLVDYELFWQVIENEADFTDSLGHPLANCEDYRRLKKTHCHYASTMNEPIHYFFGLSYSSYLVLRRSVLQSAPVEWQRKFVALLEDLDEMFSDEYTDGEFVVQMRDKKGRFVADGLADYERGRRQIPRKN